MNVTSATSNMLMPNFLVIGAAKSGTTVLDHFLKQHPQIYMSPLKEPDFFAFEGIELNFCGPGEAKRHSITTLEEYCKLFEGVSDETVIGEASPVYLYHPKAPERIQHYIPDAKIVVILRNPVERAYSHFLMLVRDGREHILDFKQALQEEEHRRQNNWSWGWRYVDAGFYSVQLKRYFERFDKNQIKIFLYEDLDTNPLGVLQDIWKFLDVDETFVPDLSVRLNVSGMPKYQFLHKLLVKPNVVKDTFKYILPEKLRRNLIVGFKKNQSLVRPQLSLEMRHELLSVFREEIISLQDLVQRDLSAWLE